MTYFTSVKDQLYKRKMVCKIVHLVEAKAPIMFCPSEERARIKVGPGDEQKIDLKLLVTLN